MPTPTEIQMELANAMRGDRDWSTLAMLSGDRVLSPVGQEKFRAVNDRTKELTVSADKAEQRKVLQNYYDAQAKQQAAQLSELGRHNRAMEGLQGRAIDRDYDIAALKKDLGLREKYNAATEVFSKRMQDEGIPELAKAIDDLEDALPKEGNIPGVGGYENVLGIGNVTGGDAGRDIRSRIAVIRNVVLKARSGAAVTDPEMTRLIEELATGFTNSDEDFINSLKRLKGRFSAVQNNLVAGVDPSVIGLYQARGGTLFGESPVEEEVNAAAAPDAGPAPWQMNWEGE